MRQVDKGEPGGSTAPVCVSLSGVFARRGLLTVVKTLMSILSLLGQTEETCNNVNFRK